MSAWTGKPCDRCGGKKGPAYKDKKYCGRCARGPVKQAARSRAHAAYVQRQYGQVDGEYERLYEAQGGRCAICQKATGKVRRLAVDHDHECCKEPPTCGKCTRGLLCKSCNRILLGRWPLEALERAVSYLKNPPAREVLGL